MATSQRVIAYGQLTSFVRESNRIEGIHREPSLAEVDAHEHFLGLHRPLAPDLRHFVSIIAPGARLRIAPGQDVRVGRYIPPRGGPAIAAELDAILGLAHERKMTAYHVHRRYESLHPFEDGNGRSGRLLWLWMRSGHAPLGFLHHWYYESLADNQPTTPAPSAEKE